MKHFPMAALTAALLTSCSGEAPGNEQAKDEVEAPVPSGPPMPGQEPTRPRSSAGASPAWESVDSPEGTALRLVDPGGELRLMIACLGDPARLVVNVPAFEPVMSEDRFALGLGPEPVTLVADPYDQEARPGVTGEGPVPDNLEEWLGAAGEVRALYGAQQTGPLAPPPDELKNHLVSSCS